MEEIHFNCPPHFWQQQLKIIYTVVKWTIHLKSVKKIYMVVPHYMPGVPQVEKAIHMLTCWLGVTGRMNEHSSPLEWVWEAEHGKVLLWKNTENRRDYAKEWDLLRAAYMAYYDIFMGT